MVSWIGAMEWSFGVDFGVDFGVLVTLVGQDFFIDRQTVMEWSGVRFWRDSVG